IVEALLNLPLKAQRTSKEVVRPTARLIDTGRFRRRDGFFRECPSHVVIEVENAETREPNVRIRKIFARTSRLKDLASPFVLLLRARDVGLLPTRAPQPQAGAPPTPMIAHRRVHPNCPPRLRAPPSCLPAADVRVPAGREDL